MSVYRVQNNTNLSMKGTNTVASATSLLQEAVYWVDAQAGTSYIPTTASGYMYLPGVTGNYASAPDSAALSITGDIDIRAKVSLSNWIPSNLTFLVAKLGIGGNRSYRLSVDTDGTLQLSWWDSSSVNVNVNSTVATGIANDSVKWVRATLDVNNGASGRDIKFYTSDNGTTWTQLGTTVTQAATTSIFDSTQILEIGSQVSGSINAGVTHKYYRVQIYASIDSTDLRFDANFETAMTSQTVASFTESSSNAATVTVNRTTYNFQLDTINNLGTAGALLPTTLGSSTAADSNDPKFLDHTGTNYVYLPGVNSNNMTIPDAAALDITGDIDIRTYVALDDWTPGVINVLIGKDDGSTQRSFQFNCQTNGILRFLWSTTGSALSNSADSTVTTGIADGVAKWVRVTLDVDNGASGRDIKFYTSDDGTSWTQLGTTVTQAGTTSIFSGSGNVLFGASPFGTSTGKFFRAQIFDGIDGTKVLDVDTSVITAGSATSFTAVTGQTVTITRSTSGRKTVAVTQPTWLFGTDDYMEVNNRYMSSGTYLYLPGVASNAATAPDSAALDITGDIDIRCKVALDDWTPAATTMLVAKYTASGSNLSYALAVNSNGTLSMRWSPDGLATINTVASTAAPTVVDGATLWVRATLDVDNGAAGRDIIFYTSIDGTTWTQLGTTVTQAGTTSIYNSTAVLGIGAQDGGSTFPARGKFFRAQVLNGIDGTVAFDANFETSITSLLQTSFTESSANAATVTINRSGSAYRSAGITTAGYLYPGATNTFSASATDFLNFGAADSFTVMAVARQWATPVNNGVIISKSQGASPFIGYLIDNSGTGGTTRGSFYDGTAAAQSTTTYTSGQFRVLQTIVNRSNQTLTLYSNTTSGTPASTSSVGSTSIVDPLRIGRPSTGSGNFQDVEIYAAAVWRRRLLGPEIGAIYEYFNARD